MTWGFRNRCAILCTRRLTHGCFALQVAPCSCNSLPDVAKPYHKVERSLYEIVLPAVCELRLPRKRECCGMVALWHSIGPVETVSKQRPLHTVAQLPPVGYARFPLRGGVEGSRVSLQTRTEKLEQASQHPSTPNVAQSEPEGMQSRPEAHLKQSRWKVRPLMHKRLTAQGPPKKAVQSQRPR